MPMTFGWGRLNKFRGLVRHGGKQGSSLEKEQSSTSELGILYLDWQAAGKE